MKWINSARFATRVLTLLTLLIVATSGFVWGQTYKIMPLGDSITQGKFSSDQGGYRQYLQGYLTGYSISYNFVGSLSNGTFADKEHEGHDGYTAAQINSNVNGWLSTYAPNYVLLIIGANDISGSIDPSVIVGNIESIVDKIYSYNNSTYILLSSLTPRGDYPADSLTTVLSKYIKRLYEEKRADGYNVRYIGLNEMFKYNENWATEYMTDAIHPNDAGYNVIAETFFHAMINIINGGSGVFEHFNRQVGDLGNIWAYDEADFDIQVTGGQRELHNIAADAEWNHLIIYKAATDPNIVSFKYGTGANAAGIENSGYALLLNEPSYSTAKGYFVRYKTSANALELWRIKDGTISGDEIAVTPSAAPAPTAGSTFKVVISSDADEHRFDCYINDVFAGYVSDPDKFYGNGSDLYAGLLLKGSFNNNIDNFDMTVLGDAVAPAQITNLDAISSTSSSISFSWTAPGDDGTTGRATSYDIRYSESLITSANWHLANKAPAIPAPEAPGSAQAYVASGLNPGESYFFAVKTADEVLNWSAMSNVKEASTSTGGGALLKTDEFNDPNTLTQWWSANPAYVVQSGRLNNVTGVGWGQLAVFKLNVNPVEASLQWAAAPNADAAGIDKAGIATLLDAANYNTANGYLCTIRTGGASPVLYLFKMTAGTPGDLLGSATIAGKNIPAAGDVFKIVTSSDVTGHHFDYYVNEVFYGRLNDVNKFYSNGTDYYAGIELYGGLNNDVEKFTVLNQVGEPKYLEKVSPLSDPGGIVGKKLADSLTVRVLDENYNPVSNLTVDFAVTKGGGSVDITPSPEIRREAEKANVIEGQFEEGVDTQASGGRYMVVNGNGERFLGKLEFNVYIKTAGNYLMFARVKIPDNNTYSFFVQVDDAPALDTLNLSIGAWDLPRTAGVWFWDWVSERGGGEYKIWNLTQGIHKITLTTRWSPNVQIDKILLSSNFSYWPSGTDEWPEYSTDANGIAKAALTLGQTAGENEVQATAPGYTLSGAPQIFTITGNPDVPKLMVATPPTTVTGVGGQQLNSPFEVTLTDAYGNPAYGYNVTFQVTVGNGKLSNGQATHVVTTDVQGKASSYLTLSTESTANEVQVSYTGLPVVKFTATATSGIANTLAITSGNDQSGLVNTTLPTPLKVRVTDSAGAGVRNHNVHFQVTAGGGSLSPAAASGMESFDALPLGKVPSNKTSFIEGTLASTMDVLTDNNGYAQVRLQLGSAAGTNSVTATATKNGQPLSGSPKTFNATGTAGAAYAINYHSGNSQTGAAGMPLGAPFVVKVTDQYNNGIVGHQVVFEIKSGGGSFVTSGPWYSEAGGLAQVTLRLGSTSGVVNEVWASAESNGVPLDDSPVVFQATSGTVTTLTYVGGNNQTGSAGWPLQDSLKVKVLDNYGNPVGGYPVTWTCTGTNKGTVDGLEQVVKNSDSKGISKVQFICGRMPGVAGGAEAKAGSLTGSPYNFIVNVADVDAIHYVSGDAQTGTVGSVLPQPFKAEIIDALGKPIPGFPVVFTVRHGDGKLSGDTTITVQTDNDKVAQTTLTLGPQPGTNNNVVEAAAFMSGKEMLANGGLDIWDGDGPDKWTLTKSASGATVLQNSSDSRSGNCVEMKVTTISAYSTLEDENTYIVTPNVTYELSFWVKGANGGEKIWATFKQGNYYLLSNGDWSSQSDSWMKNQIISQNYKKYSILFTSRNTEGLLGKVKLTLMNNSNATVFFDDVSLIEKNAGGETPLNGSPLTYTASATIGAPNELKYVSGNYQSAVVGNPLESRFLVKVVDVLGNPYTGHPVKFTVKTGGGTLDGQSLTTVTKNTDGNGEAGAILTVGLSSGENNNSVEVVSYKPGTTTNLVASPMTFFASGRASAAKNLEYVSGNGQPASAVREKLAQPFRVKVTDNAGNPVPDHQVQWIVIQGHGTFNNLTDSVKTDPTDATGISDVYYYPGPTAGLTNIVRARSWNGPELSGSPKTFQVETKASSVSAQNSTITATSPIPADGTTKSTITVTLMDAYGNKISGKALAFFTTGSGNIPTPFTELTNANGQAVAYLASTRAEEKTITVRDISDGIDLLSSAKITFTPLAAHAIGYVSGTNQTRNFGTALKDLLKARVTDANGNPIANHDVTFEAYVGGGSIYEKQPIKTDANGVASATWILGLSEEVNRARATAYSISGSVDYIATAYASTATTLKKISGDSQTGTAGLPLSNNFIARVVDGSDNPIFDYPVKYKVSFGGGNFNGASSIEIRTDAFGNASRTFTLGRVAGSNVVTVEASALSGSPQGFTAQGVAGEAAKITKWAGEGKTGSVGGQISGIQVKVTDIFDNAVSGYTVTFSVIQGDATMSGSGAVISGADGVASATINVGSTVGEIHVMASAPGMIGDGAKITVYAVASAPVSMEIYKGNNQQGTVGRELVYPLSIVVLDQYGNPVTGQNTSISFVVTEGTGQLLDGPAVYTDENGIASVRFKLGSVTGSNYKVWAINNGLAGSPREFQATGVGNKFPLFNAINDASLQENQSISFTVSATDEDGDPVQYGIRDIPDGAAFDSTNTKQFSWTPSYLQAGKHVVHFMVKDNKGGFDDEPVTIDVTNINRMPQIDYFEPVNHLLVGHKSIGETFRMIVQVSDPDYDEVTYEWYDNGLLVGSQNYYDFFVVSEELGTHYIVVKISDPYDTIQRDWEIYVKTPVELANFSGHIVKRRGVALQWETTSEVAHSGFNVLRREASENAYRQVNTELIKSNGANSYNYLDQSVEVGATYSYKLEDVSINGQHTEHDAITIFVARPDRYELQQNYPNPFNPKTNIEYQLPMETRVSLKIYNIMGQEVKTLIDDVKEAGYHALIWNGLDNSGVAVSSGIYYYRMVTGSFVETKKMVLLR
ncbi:MAG: Ig-like domain-containing protein [Candidatus Zhuqueibacterota bacterium]